MTLSATRNDHTRKVFPNKSERLDGTNQHGACIQENPEGRGFLVAGLGGSPCETPANYESSRP